jgi:hypothetical protein
MGIQVSGMETVLNLFSRLIDFQKTGIVVAVDRGAKDLTKGYQKAIEAGLGADGSPLAPLKKSTLEGPIRVQDNSRKRSDLGGKPLSATGATARSIGLKKVGMDTWEISSNTAKGDAILSSNAKGGGKDAPFAGDVRKVKRDPLQVSDKQIDVLEDAIVKVLDRMLNGG